MATYNGEKYIKNQLDSILPELGKHDEVIVVDDCSSDNTVAILSEYSNKDARIKVYRNEKNIRHVKTFEKAVGLAKNELIVFSDQDDLWVPGRVDVFQKAFKENPNVVLVTGSFDCIDADGNLINNELRKVSAADSFAYKKNIASIFKGTLGYYGCVMVVKRDFVQKILPFPEGTEAHDLYIALAANIARANLHLDDKVLLHRVHGRNASDLKRGIVKKLGARAQMLKNYQILRKKLQTR